MKKLMMAAVVAHLASQAHAQSALTVFGTIDAGVGYIQSTGAGHKLGLINSGSATSRLGFRGTEDLGGGLAVGFWLEGALNNDVGGGASQTTGFDFQRRATVSLLGPFGEVRLGRDFVATYPILFAFDATSNRGLGEVDLFGVSGAGVSTASAFRVSNSLSYFLPANNLGITGQLQVALGEANGQTQPVTDAAGLSTSAAAAGTRKTGNFFGGRLAYKNGALGLAGSYGLYTDAVRAAGTSFYAEDYEIANVGALYDFGVVKLNAFMQIDKIGGRANIDGYQLNTYAVGAVVPVGRGALRAQYSRYDRKRSADDADKLAVGYVYDLSKRTTLYTEVGYMDSKGAGIYAFDGIGGLPNSPKPTAGGSTRGYTVGIKHSF